MTDRSARSAASGVFGVDVAKEAIDSFNASVDASVKMARQHLISALPQRHHETSDGANKFCRELVGLSLAMLRPKNRKPEIPTALDSIGTGVAWPTPTLPRPPKAWIQTALAEFPSAVIRQTERIPTAHFAEPSIEVLLQEQGQRLFRQDKMLIGPLETLPSGLTTRGYLQPPADGQFHGLPVAFHVVLMGIDERPEVVAWAFHEFMQRGWLAIHPTFAINGERSLSTTAALWTWFENGCPNDDSPRGSEPSHAPAAVEPPAAQTHSRMTNKSANEKAMKLAKADTSFAKAPTARRWAKAIGCSLGLVPKLPFWLECQKRLGMSDIPKKPKAVSLTDNLAATLGQLDPELERLIAEQAADDKPSCCPRSRRASV